eukprot:3470158-Rhodomonas_salina.1
MVREQSIRKIESGSTPCPQRETETETETERQRELPGMELPAMAVRCPVLTEGMGLPGKDIESSDEEDGGGRLYLPMLSGTDVAYGPTYLPSACYALSGTEIAYGATRRGRSRRTAAAAGIYLLLSPLIQTAADTGRGRGGGGCKEEHAEELAEGQEP